MNCCRKESYSPLSFRKEPWASGLPGQPVAGWAGVRMEGAGNEGSLCLPAMDCFPCFRTQPLLVDVLPGVFDALLSVFMGLFCFKMLQALFTCWVFSSFACSFFSTIWRVVCLWALACSGAGWLGWGSCSGLQCHWGVGERILKGKLDKPGALQRAAEKASPSEEVL